MKLEKIHVSFVEFIPEVLEAGMLYVSTRYATASHLCACGCGQKVVTPIRPTDWTLLWDGDSVSLRPSIGNFGMPCQSHYWISNGRIIWAAAVPDALIKEGRDADRRAKKRYFAERQAGTRPLRDRRRSTGSRAKI